MPSSGPVIHDCTSCGDLMTCVQENTATLGLDLDYNATCILFSFEREFCILVNILVFLLCLGFACGDTHPQIAAENVHKSLFIHFFCSRIIYFLLECTVSGRYIIIINVKGAFNLLGTN